MCWGADSEFHAYCTKLDIRIIGHPGVSRFGRAFKRAKAVCAETRSPLPFLLRNRVIVDASHLLIATPRTADEELRSGTWATIRYARKQAHPLVIINPDGSELWEHWEGVPGLPFS